MTHRARRGPRRRPAPRAEPLLPHAQRRAPRDRGVGGAERSRRGAGSSCSTTLGEKLSITHRRARDRSRLRSASRMHTTVHPPSTGRSAGRAPPSDLAARPLRHRRPRRRARSRFSTGPRARACAVAGAAAQSAGLRLLAVRLPLVVRRQSAADLAAAVAAGRICSSRRTSPTCRTFSADRVEFEQRRPSYKFALLRKAWTRFDDRRRGARRVRDAPEQREWLDDYALYMALKERAGGAPWWEWDRALARARAEGARRARATSSRTRSASGSSCSSSSSASGTIVREAAHARGIRIIGDVPIYVARRQRRRLGQPRAVPARRRRPADRRRRRAARLLQRDRPALGQSALPLGR